ncbi:hypothetical protein ACHAWF_015919 [Thalassiosira exigua]
MVELSLFSDWTHCSACGLPSDRKPRPDDPTACPLAIPPKKLMACADCGCVAYHDSDCQRSHWKSGHRRECKELAGAVLPLKELMRWHKLHKKVKKSDSADGAGARGIDSAKRIWCWWEPDNENGITGDTLKASNDAWRKGAQEWEDGNILEGMQLFQQSLDIYRKAWPYIGKSSGTNERREHGLDDFFERSFMLAKRLIFCAYCELDASQVDSARQRLVQSLSITMTIFFTAPARASRDSVRNVMNDAWVELMMSMEEVPQHRIIARHVASMAISTKATVGWANPWQRPGYMAKMARPSVPYTPVEKHPQWCRTFQNNWIRILNEYHALIENPLNFSNVGSGQRGSGHDDHLVVSGRSWKEYVLFGMGSKRIDDDAPITKQLLRNHVPEAVSLAEQGGGEVIFSRLAARTHIKAHCGPTNLRLTAHLGLIVPHSPDCRIRVKDEWHHWTPGKILIFDDSYEHEVKNDTNEERVVLLIRIWHPGLAGRRESFLSEARARKDAEIAKRYNPPR